MHRRASPTTGALWASETDGELTVCRSNIRLSSAEPPFAGPTIHPRPPAFLSPRPTTHDPRPTSGPRSSVDSRRLASSHVVTCTYIPTCTLLSEDDLSTPLSLCLSVHIYTSWRRILPYNYPIRYPLTTNLASLFRYLPRVAHPQASCVSCPPLPSAVSSNKRRPFDQRQQPVPKHTPSADPTCCEITREPILKAARLVACFKAVGSLQFSIVLPACVCRSSSCNHGCPS